MRVESLIRRANGHVVELDGVCYAFQPATDYGCVVEVPAHVARFRAIPEGYRVVAEETAVAGSRRRARRLMPAGQAVLIADDGRD